eukprot:GDKI01046654.1.p1 GENE.GDKI01046654.1~~GDKI01046654.1.p1  ORF type:complete len:148 (-),score=70.35 GDKI01046654.1:67-510(-)
MRVCTHAHTQRLFVQGACETLSIHSDAHMLKRAHTHTNTHAYTHTRVHTHTHTHDRKGMRQTSAIMKNPSISTYSKCVCPHTHTHTCSITVICAHTRTVYTRTTPTLTHTHTRTNIGTHASLLKKTRHKSTNAYTCARAHTNLHAHI